MVVQLQVENPRLCRHRDPRGRFHPPDTLVSFLCSKRMIDISGKEGVLFRLRLCTLVLVQTHGYLPYRTSLEHEKIILVVVMCICMLYMYTRKKDGSLRSKCRQLGISVSEASHPPFSLEIGCPKRTLPAHPTPLRMEKHLRQIY